MAEGTKEVHLEEHVVKYLIKIAQPEFPEYTVKDTSCYDKDLCVIPEDVVGFFKDTQPEKYNAIVDQLGIDADKKIAWYASKAVESLKHKTISYFRTKLKISGQHLEPVFFKPQDSKSPEHQDWYSKNRLTIIRQLKYSKKNENAIDLALFVNGIPVATMELKNALTGQYLHNAIKQYIED